MLGPVARFLARLAHHPLPDRHDQPRILGQRDELARADKTMIGAVPANQCLETDHVLAAGIDHGLVMQHHLVAAQGLAQGDFELAPLFCRCVQHRLEPAMLPAAQILGLVERKVGIAHDFLDRPAIARTFGRTDAGPHIQGMMIDHVGFRQTVDHPFRQIADHARRARIADHDRKFVAAQTAHHLMVAHQRLQPRRNLREQLVAGHVAKRIVDRLEPVQIDHQQRTAPAPLRGITQRLAHRLGQLQAVGQLGQRVVARKIGDLFRRIALLGDVRSDPAEPGEPAQFVAHGRARKLPPAFLAEDRHLHQQAREILAVLEAFGQIVKAGGELSAFPAGPGDHLEQRTAFDLALRAAQGKGETRRYRPQPARGIDLPQPVGLVLLELPKQQRDDFLFLAHRGLGQPRFDESGAHLHDRHKAGDREQDRPARCLPLPLKRERRDRAQPQRADIDHHAQRRGRENVGRRDHQHQHHQQQRDFLRAAGEPGKPDQGRDPAHGTGKGIAVLQ